MINERLYSMLNCFLFLSDTYNYSRKNDLFKSSMFSFLLLFQYYRVYSPIVFGKKTDPHGLYIRKYLPKLKKFPDNYIFEPWTAPLSVQKVTYKVAFN